MEIDPYSPLSRARGRANRYREDRRKADAITKAERELQREKIRKQRAKLEEAELQFRREQEIIASQCQICSALQAQAWGMEYPDWAERRCGACFAAEAEHKATMLHIMRADGSLLEEVNRAKSDEIAILEQQIPSTTNLEKRAARRPERRDPQWYHDIYAEEQFWTGALPELERRMSGLAPADEEDHRQMESQTRGSAAQTRDDAEGLKQAEIHSRSAFSSSSTVAKNRGNPWSSSGYEVTSSIKDEEDAESVAELPKLEDSKDEDGRSDEARTESSGQGRSAAEATAGSDTTASQRDYPTREEGAEEDFKELLVRYRPAPALSPPRINVDKTDQHGRNPAPKENQANEEDQSKQVDADEDDAAKEDYGEPLSTEEMIEMLKLAEDCVVLGQTQLEREKALLVAADLRKAISYSRLRHRRLPTRTAIREDSHERSKMRLINASQSGHRLGNRAGPTTTQEERAKVLSARKRDKGSKLGQRPPEPGTHHWVPAGKAELPLGVEHRDGYGVAGEPNAMVPGVHLPIHEDATPLQHGNQHGNQVNVHLLRMRQASSPSNQRSHRGVSRQREPLSPAHRTPTWRSAGGGQW